MNVVLELKNTPKLGDILVCDKDGIKSISKVAFLGDLLKEIKELHIALENADKSINELNKEIRILKGEE